MRADAASSQDRRTEPHPAVRRRRDHKFLRRQRADNALHRRTRQIDALRDLAEAQAVRFIFKDTQDGGGARDHLDLTLIAAFVA